MTAEPPILLPCPTTIDTPIARLCEIADGEGSGAVLSDAGAAIARLAIEWAGECLTVTGSPATALALVEGCAAVAVPELKASDLGSTPPELGYGVYSERLLTGAETVDWRNLRGWRSLEATTTLEVEIATAEFLLQMVSDKYPYADTGVRAFTAVTSWATATVEAVADQAHQGVPRAGLERMVTAVGDATVEAGLRTLDDLTEEVLDAIGCPPGTGTRLGVTALSTTWNGSVQDLIDTALRIWSDEPADDPEPTSDGRYWVRRWDQACPAEYPWDEVAEYPPFWSETPMSWITDLRSRDMDEWYAETLPLGRLLLDWGAEYYAHVGASTEAHDVYATARKALDIEDDAELAAYLAARPGFSKNPETGKYADVPWRCDDRTWTPEGPPGFFENCDFDHDGQLWEWWLMPLYYSDDLIDHRMGTEATQHYFNTSIHAQLDVLLPGVVERGLRNLDELTDELLDAVGCPTDQRSRLAVTLAAKRWRRSLTELLEAAPTLRHAVSIDPSDADSLKAHKTGVYWSSIGSARDRRPRLRNRSSRYDPPF